MIDNPEIGPARPTVGELIGALLQHGEAFVRAELALYRAQVAQKMLSARSAAALFVAALALVQAASVALIVGLVLALQPAVGIGWALLIVVGGCFAMAGLLAWIGVGKIKAMLAREGSQ